MVSLQHILDNINSTVTIIFGNNGRSPHHLSYMLDTCFPDMTTRIQSPYWVQSKLDSSYEDDGTRCDILIILEPPFQYDVVKPNYADRLIVFTSHLSLNIPETSTIVSNHVGNANKNPRNWRGYEESVAKNADIILKPEIFYFGYVVIPKDNPIWIDLTECETAHEAFLRLLNARDVLVQEDTHESWIVALPFDLRQEIKLHLDKTDHRLNENCLMETNTDGIVKLKNIYTTTWKRIVKDDDDPDAGCDEICEPR